jgi:hypothetical protein
MNIYVAAPASNLVFNGSYVGVEVNDATPGEKGSIQIRSSSISCVKPTGLQTYNSSDILQTTPSIISNPSYLASAGIQVGPGTDLVTKSAGSKPFSTYTYPTTLYYGLKGQIKLGAQDGYLWPGTQVVSGNFPDTTNPPAYYRCQQPLILSGMNLHCNTGAGVGSGVTLEVYRTPLGATGPSAVLQFNVSLTGAMTNASYYSTSQDFAAGDLIHSRLTYTGNNANIAEDITLQLDLF